MHNIISLYTKPAALLLFSTVAISATAQAIFKGRITDEKHQPVAFANAVLLNSADSAFIEGAVSKADGSFTLTASPSASGNYLLKVSSTGYKTDYRTIQQSGNIGTIELKSDVIRLKGATVTASRLMLKTAYCHVRHL